MGYSEERAANAKLIKKWAIRVVVILSVVIALCMVGLPYYNVWQQQMAGKAALMKATQDRQITVQDALAKKDSAANLAQADIIRARGVAQANKIIGDSLKNNEAYLRYLWVDGLQSTKNQVIYVPTEGNLPIMESTRNLQNERVTAP